MLWLDDVSEQYWTIVGYCACASAHAWMQSYAWYTGGQTQPWVLSHFFWGRISYLLLHTSGELAWELLGILLFPSPFQCGSTGASVLSYWVWRYIYIYEDIYDIYEDLDSGLLVRTVSTLPTVCCQPLSWKFRLTAAETLVGSACVPLTSAAYCLASRSYSSVHCLLFFVWFF